MFEALRAMVRDELRQAPGFVFGQMVEPVGTLNKATFWDGANVAGGIRNLTPYALASGQNGLFVHVGNLQAVAYLQASHVNVGGASPPVVSV